jgi:hypothetical protein
MIHCLCDDVMINIISYVIDEDDFCSLRMVSKRWNKITMSKVCLKTFLEYNYGLDERRYLNDHYKSLFYCSRRLCVNTIIQCGFYKKLKLPKWRQNEECLLNLFVLALNNERPQTISELYVFVKPFLNELTREILNAFGLLLKQNSFIIQIILEKNFGEFLSEGLFDLWFKYSSFENFEKYTKCLSTENVYNCVNQLITIYSYDNYLSFHQKVKLLLSILVDNINLKQLQKYLFSLNYHKTMFSSTVTDFVISFPLHDLIKFEYFTIVLLINKKFDFFLEHLDILEQPSVYMIRELIELNLQIEFQHLVKLKKYHMNEETALSMLKTLVNQHRNKLLILEWHKLLFNSINEECKSEFNPFQKLSHHPIKVIKFWCKPKYVIDFILKHKISDYYSDCEFLKFLKHFLKHIKQTDETLKKQIIVRMFYSLGLKSKTKRCKRSIIKTFKIIKTWMPNSDPLILKVRQKLINYMPFHYWSLD